MGCGNNPCGVWLVGEKSHIKHIGSNMPAIGFRIQHHQKQILIVFDGSGDKTASCFSGISGFYADGIRVFIEELVVGFQTIDSMSCLFCKNSFVKAGYFVENRVLYRIFRKA